MNKTEIMHLITCVYISKTCICDLNVSTYFIEDKMLLLNSRTQTRQECSSQTSDSYVKFFTYIIIDSMSTQNHTVLCY